MHFLQHITQLCIHQASWFQVIKLNPSGKKNKQSRDRTEPLTDSHKKSRVYWVQVLLDADTQMISPRTCFSLALCFHGLMPLLSRLFASCAKVISCSSLCLPIQQSHGKETITFPIVSINPMVLGKPLWISDPIQNKLKNANWSDLWYMHHIPHELNFGTRHLFKGNLGYCNQKIRAEMHDKKWPGKSNTLPIQSLMDFKYFENYII